VDRVRSRWPPSTRISFWKLQARLVSFRSSPNPPLQCSTTKSIQFNRPKSLNAFGGKLMEETISAIRELDEHPDTVFTVLTGEGRFFSAGADVRGESCPSPEWKGRAYHVPQLPALMPRKSMQRKEKRSWLI
jgi:hypothetical protein